ncbi:MAG: FAD-dependent oxidoreductase, partial [Alphaproteobacteria bacterium]
MAARHVVIIGAGAVGAASALAALKEGYRVTILDPAEPGGEQAASYGNGCWLSPMSVIPPAVPGIWKKLPKFLSDPLGPLAIRWGYLPKVAPWLIRYLASGWRWEDVAKTAGALRPLVQDAPRLHKALADQAGVGHLIERRGLMYIYPS